MMCGVKGSLLLILSVVFPSFSQTKIIEKGSYLSTNKGKQIKLNLLENNKFEMVFYRGDYLIKDDSLRFISKGGSESVFDLDIKEAKAAKKIKISFQDISYYGFYIGTQKDSQPVHYQRLLDIQKSAVSQPDNLDLNFEIDPTDYLYLVYEGWNDQDKTKISKYKLPKDTSEITIKYNPNSADLNVVGYFDKKTGELRISDVDGSGMPDVFVNEKNVPKVATPKVVAIENLSVSNWTYPRKKDTAENSGTTVESTICKISSDNYGFKFKIQKNLKDAIAVTKQEKSKFLIVYCDEKNPNAKKDFDSFIEYNQEIMSSNIYDPEDDLFNYYLASAADKNWIKANAVSDYPAVVILNGDGDILATKKTKLSDVTTGLCYYCGIYKKIKTVNAIVNFSKTIKDKKTSDTDLITAFSSLTDFYDYDFEYAYSNDKQNSFNMRKMIDEKEVNLVWKKLIEAHQKDKIPNLKLGSIILREIQDKGFSKILFNGGKILNDTDFLSIDYLLKYYQEIENSQKTLSDEDSNGLDIESLNTFIAYALNDNIDVEQNGKTGKSNLEKMINVHKKLIEIGKSNFPCYQYYFSYLTDQSSKSGSDTVLIKEFESYFDKFLFTEKGDYIAKLDELFSSDFSFDCSWDSFKEFHSDLCNSIAWKVVSKPQNSNFLKKAIKWSEYSLVVTKNNPYYLDTLAQLYYKDGQKEKAIATETLAVKYLNADAEEETALEIKTVLAKMQNGTY